MSDITVPAIGGLIAGCLASIIAVLVVRRRGPVVMACLCGRASTGKVLRVERNEASKARLRISFPISDGREVDYLEPIEIKARVGESVRVCYRQTNPVVATSCRLRDLLAEMFVFGAGFGVAGVMLLAGSLYSLVKDDRRIFYGVTGAGFFGLIACIFLFVAGQSVARARASQRMVVAEGLVKRVKSKRGDEAYPHPLISFTSTDGRDLEYWDPELSGRAPGEKVRVYYDPDYPEFTASGIEKSGHVGQSAFCGLAGVLSVLICGWFAWTYLVGSS